MMIPVELNVIGPVVMTLMCGRGGDHDDGDNDNHDHYDDCGDYYNND